MIRHLKVQYHFLDRHTGRYGDGDATFQLDCPDPTQIIDLDDPEQRQRLERHITDAILKESPRYKPGRFVVLVTDCSPVPEPG